MNYTTFSKLYHEALEYSNLELYIAERGWQDWMDAYLTDNNDASQVSDILTRIYIMAHQPIKEMRIGAGFKTRAGFARDYSIPLRTLEDWESGAANVTQYVKALIAYTFFVSEEMKNEQD